MELKVIARIHTDFPEKFGIPRQSGLARTHAQIVFEEEYRNPDAVRGIEQFSHLWLLWEFSEVKKENWNPTVRPPRLGGNKRVGVFATRSPFRPNPVGLSSVRLDKAEVTEQYGTVLHVTGADLMDGTPIFDIKPYLPYVDSHSDAVDGFAGKVKDYCLQVEIPHELEKKIPEAKRASLREVLSQDPRPSYQNDPDRVYGMAFAGMDVKFRAADGILNVIMIEEYK